MRTHFARRNLLAPHKPTFQNFILFEQFQIALPLIRIGTILLATDIDPVGVGQYPKSELPP
jgi:hypothetical protein